MASQSQSLSQQQQQTLRLSPQQMRFGRLLEMSVPEFEEEVAIAVDENPALEAIADPAAPLPQKDDEGHDFTESADELQRADYGSDEEVPYYRTNISNRSADDEYMRPEAADNSAAMMSLDRQIEELGLSEDMRELTSFVAASLDSNGYLTRTPLALADDIAMSLGIEPSPEQVKQAIQIIRELEPAGIGAENLRDCLLLQLRRLEHSQSVNDATDIIDKEFYLFANRKYKKVRADLGIDEIRLDEACKLIRSLNPKPATLLENTEDDRLRHITPDFIIDTDSDGHINVSMAGRLPELAIEESFRRGAAGNPAAETFIKARRSEAEEFIGMARRRYDTLMAVMNAIVKLQPDYFRSYDRSDLRPMVLRQVADATGINLSVVSRATAGKYALTPRGTVPLKSLFSESVSDDSDVSVYKIEKALRKLVDNEDSSAPLSDDAIATALAAQGLSIARRTVAKYRERMGIQPARLRKIE